MPHFDKNLLIAVGAISILIISLAYKVNIYLFVISIICIFCFFIWHINKSFKINISNIVMDKEENSEKKKTVIKPLKSNILFKDIAGMQDIKDEFLDIIAMFKKDNKYKKLHIRPPKGILLVGEPGVGKTMIARALSNECDTSFFYQSGSSFANMYVGSGSSNIKILFDEAKKHSPSIVFIDEIDALGKSRGNNRNDERESTLNELLVQIDGFEYSQDIMVLGATNKIEVMDKALIRSGRFDRKIFIPLPRRQERKEIIKFYLDKHPNKIDIDILVDMSMGYSGADISTMVNEASLVAFKENSKYILNEHFYKININKINQYSKEDKSILALYKSAKFFVAHELQLDIADKIFIFTQDFITNPNKILSRSYLEDIIKVSFAGIIAVEIIHNNGFDIFKDDLNKVSQIAKDIILMGAIEDKKEILNKQKEETKKYIAENKKAILILKDALLENEVLSVEDIKSLKKV